MQADIDFITKRLEEMEKNSDILVRDLRNLQEEIDMLTFKDTSDDGIKCREMGVEGIKPCYEFIYGKLALKDPPP